jgi:hypothetical protein
MAKEENVRSHDPISVSATTGKENTEAGILFALTLLENVDKGAYQQLRMNEFREPLYVLLFQRETAFFEKRITLCEGGRGRTMAGLGGGTRLARLVRVAARVCLAVVSPKSDSSATATTRTTTAN